MEKQSKALLPSIVGDSEGSCMSGPNTKGPTPTVADVVQGLKDQALTLCQIGLSEFDPDENTERFEQIARYVTAIYGIANGIDVWVQE